MQRLPGAQNEEEEVHGRYVHMRQFERVGAILRVAGGVACSGKCFVHKVDELNKAGEQK